MVGRSIAYIPDPELYGPKFWESCWHSHISAVIDRGECGASDKRAAAKPNEPWKDPLLTSPSCTGPYRLQNQHLTTLDEEGNIPECDVARSHYPGVLDRQLKSTGRVWLNLARSSLKPTRDGDLRGATNND
jgi:hypothetical protein